MVPHPAPPINVRLQAIMSRGLGGSRPHVARRDDLTAWWISHRRIAVSIKVYRSFAPRGFDSKANRRTHIS
jgi:hypothetical protein